MSRSTDGPAARAPVEHRTPTSATVKQLYGTAFRCAKPDCRRPLYRMNDETGETVLNSRVAHIHARSEGGPRWDRELAEEDNRNSANLVLLCLEHASEVDDTPEHYPAEMLLDWKAAQLAEFAEVGRSWPLSDTQVAEVSVLSFDAHPPGMATVAAAAVLDTARAVGMLIETGRSRRLVANQVAAEWQALRARVNHSMPVWDGDGNRLQVEPSYIETRPYAERLDNTLAESRAVLDGLRASLSAELRAVSTMKVELAPWCQWLERTAGMLVNAAGRWPGRPPEADDQLWSDSIVEVERALAALSAAWRGEPTAPPPTPVTPPPAGETEGDRLVREYTDLLESARPWARVKHRPYDPELFDQLVNATAIAATLPPVPSFLHLGLDSTARLAAYVARNAEDDTYSDLIDRAADQQPLAVACALVVALMSIAKDAEKAELSAKATGVATSLLQTETWSDPQVWADNRLHARIVLNTTAWLTSDDDVRQTLITALRTSPDILDGMLGGIAQWSESFSISGIRDSSSELFNRISDLPAWFPTEQAIAAIEIRFPGLVPSDPDFPARGTPDSTERLAAQVLHAAARSDG